MKIYGNIDEKCAIDSQRLFQVERFEFMETTTVVEEREEYQPCKLVVLDRKEQLHSKRGYWALRRGQDIFFSALALLIP